MEKNRIPTFLQAHQKTLHLLWRLVESFAGAAAALFITGETEPQYLSLIVFLLLFWLTGREGERPSRRMRVTAGVFALFFAGTTVLANYGWLAKEYGFFSPYTGWMLLLCWIFFRAMLLLLYTWLAGVSVTAKKVRSLSPGGVFVLSFGVLLAVYTVCFLCNFPGNVMADSRTQLAQIVGLDPYSNHHPMAHTLLMQAFFNLGLALFHTQNAGVACITVSQYVAVAAVFSYCISILYRFRVGTGLLIASLLFFALAPNNLLFSITIVKDIPFAIMALLMCLCLWRLVALPDEREKMSGKKWVDWALFAVSCLGVCLLRTNGIYAFLVFLPLCLIFLPKKEAGVKRWRLLSVMTGALALGLLFRGPVLTAMGVTPPDAIEALSIPAQHIARVVTDDCTLSDGDYALLSEIVEVEEIPETYVSYTADPIKELVRAKGNQGYLKAHWADYLKLWLRLGIQNPKEYLFAQIDETVGFWYPNVSYDSLYLGGIHPETTRLDISTEPVLTGEISALLTAWLTGGHIWPVYGLLYCIGTATWMAVALMGFAIVKKRTWALLPYLFGLLVFGTLMLATPVHAEFRYLYTVFVLLPLYLVLPYTDSRGQIEERT